MKKMILNIFVLMIMPTLLLESSSAVASLSLKLALTTEPPSLDSSKATDSESFFILGHIMEGLTRYNESGKIVPGIAEKWEISDSSAKFFLRKNAKWSDGVPVKAQDFIYSWKRALDPKIASQYAFILYHLKNGESINKGEKPLSELGAKALNDTTIEITFEQPCGYFLSLTTFATYFPMREDFVKKTGEKFASSPETFISNGAFRLTSWVHGANLILEKNPTYWAEKEIKLASIEIPYITPDDNARFNLFKTQKIDILGLSKENLMNAQREKFKLEKFADGTLLYMLFNFREGKLTKNLNLRKAIRLVFNPQEYVSRVIGIPGTLPGLGLIPRWVPGEKSLFRKEFPLTPSKSDLALAKKHLAEAMKELSLSSPPSLVWLTGDSPIATKEAEYMQSLFKKTLGIDLRIDKQIFKQRLAKMKSGEFDIVAAGWGPDYNDAMTFADLFASWNGSNSGKWQNTTYDQAILKAYSTSKQKIRMESMAMAEKILLDELPIIPLYERATIYTKSPKLKGVVRRAVGFDPDYTRAVIVE